MPNLITAISEAVKRDCRPNVTSDMSSRILYFRGGILEDSENFASEDLLEAASAASSRHPHLTAEVWHAGRKVAVVGPYWERRPTNRR